MLVAYPNRKKIEVVDAEDVCNFYANAKKAEFAGNLCIKRVKLHKKGQPSFLKLHKKGQFSVKRLERYSTLSASLVVLVNFSMRGLPL